MLERGRGFLTHDDREYLLGRKAYSHVNTELNTKRRIRERLANALLDLAYLSRMHDGELEDTIDMVPGDSLDPALETFVAEMYRCLDTERFLEVAGNGIEEGVEVEVEVRLTLEEVE